MDLRSTGLGLMFIIFAIAVGALKRAASLAAAGPGDRVDLDPPTAIDVVTAA